MLESSNPNIELEGKEVKEAPKPVNADELMLKVEELGAQLRALIVESKRVPREKGLEAHQDPVRALALAQSNLQTGFMWLRRSIKPSKDF